MSAPDIPSDYTVRPRFETPFNLNATLAGGVRAELAGGVTASVGGTQVPVGVTLGGGLRAELAGGITTTNSITLAGDRERPLVFDANLLVRNLPQFSLEDIHGLIDRIKRCNLRARLPIQLNFGLSVFPLNLFGIDALQFSICGEPQLILDEYVPNAYERCAVDCEPCEE